MSKKIKIILGIVILAIVLILFSATTLWQTKTKSSSLISQNLMLKNGIAVGRNSDSYKTIQSVASDSIMVTEESIKSSVNKNERMIIKTGSLSMVVKDKFVVLE